MTCKDRLKLICDTITEQQKELNRTRKQIEELERQGITNARLHWPKDKNGALELLHSTHSEYYQQTGRRREYVGKNPHAIAAAKARKKRFRERRELIKKRLELERTINRFEYHLGMLERLAKGELATPIW